MEENILQKKLSDFDGQMFLIHRQRNGQKINELSEKVKNLIAESGMSVSVANGFLDYMKIVVSINSYLPEKK